MLESFFLFILKLVIFMYVFLNKNPFGLRIGDCVIRAISTALDQSWEKTYVDLCVEGYSMGDLPNSNATWGAYLVNKGYKRHIIPDTCPSCYTIDQFAADHPQGTYIVATGTHAVCIKDGNIYDTWNSGQEIPTYYFSKE